MCSLLSRCLTQPINMKRILCCLALLLSVATDFFVLHAQLPPDVIVLARVKIPEKQKSDQLCPVHLVASDPALPVFRHQGVAYRGHREPCQAEFEKHPEQYVESARYQRWETNFLAAMSVIWCPVTDQVNTGDFQSWEKLGLKWKSCCKFCNASVFPECFPEALKRLKSRAKMAYTATQGKYVEGSESPILDAIEFPE